jgi:hypothetical protein
MLQADGHERFNALSRFTKGGGNVFYYHASNVKDKEHTNLPLLHTNRKQLEKLQNHLLAQI